MFKKFLFILAVINLSNGHLMDYLISNSIAKTKEHFIETLITHPIISSTSFVSSNAFAAAVNLVTKLPLAVSRAIGPVRLSSRISKINNIDVVDKLIADFNAGKKNEDATMSIDTIIVKYGYPVEKYEVITEDGYVLTVFRIPGTGPAVFLMHGLLGSADDYIVVGPDSGLAYLLANQGYDVWMGNARGCKHSRRHVKLKPSNAAFWDFSWHEIGIYDLPAMIEFILRKRNVTSVRYIGHSQGTTAFFVMASEKPEYNAKISGMVALSPVAFMSKLSSPIVKLLSPGTSLLHEFSKHLGVYEFLPDNAIINALKLLICGTGPLVIILCSNIIFIIAGFDFGQLNITNLPVIFGHLPAGASVKQFAHYGQGLISEDFRKFDYGSEENMVRYGVNVAPSYELEKVVAPVYLFYSEADWLAHPSDVEQLHKKLSNVVDTYKIPYDQFNHVDFVFAKDVKKLVYRKLLKVISTF